jgi:asparagine synthase (glutamine-hydrolysing)
LPREIVYRDKVGFGTPVGRWLRNKKGLGSFLDLLTDQTFRQRGYFDGREVERLVREHVEKGLNHEEALWGLLNLELWCRTFIDSQDAVTHFHARRVPQDSRPTILSSSPSPVVEAPTTQA